MVIKASRVNYEFQSFRRKERVEFTEFFSVKWRIKEKERYENSDRVSHRTERNDLLVFFMITGSSLQMVFSVSSLT